MLTKTSALTHVFWWRTPSKRPRPLLLKDRRSAFALEFAMVAPVFFALLLMVFEISYDLFLQEVLSNSLQIVARDIQVGKTEDSDSASSFMSTYFCPASTSGLLNCNSLFLRVEEMNFSTGTCANLDFYDATTGTPPVSGRNLQLGGFWSVQGVGSGASLNTSPCATTSSSSGYCNPSSQSPILLSAVYVAPSFLAGLLSPVLYNGSFVRPIFATAALATEAFTPIANPPLQC